MAANEGTLDRVLRLIIGIALIIVGATAGLSSTLMWVLVVVGALLTITGAIGWCGLYAVLGISTKKKEADPAPPAEAAQASDTPEPSA